MVGFYAGVFLIASMKFKIACLKRQYRCGFHGMHGHATVSMRVAAASRSVDDVGKLITKVSLPYRFITGDVLRRARYDHASRFQQERMIG